MILVKTYFVLTLRSWTALNLFYPLTTPLALWKNLSIFFNFQKMTKNCQHLTTLQIKASKSLKISQLPSTSLHSINFKSQNFIQFLNKNFFSISQQINHQFASKNFLDLKNNGTIEGGDSLKIWLNLWHKFSSKGMTDIYIHRGKKAE